MPLYWFTKKTIANKKYALIKPIPLTMDYEGEEKFIELIEKHLDFFIAKGYVKKIDDKDQQYTISLMLHGAFEE